MLKIIESFNILVMKGNKNNIKIIKFGINNNNIKLAKKLRKLEDQKLFKF